FSPDGKRLATGGGEGDLGRGSGVKIWDLATGRETLNLGGAHAVSHVSFRSDGRRLAAAFSDVGLVTPGMNHGFLSPVMNPLGLGSDMKIAEVKIWNAAP